MIKIGTWKGEPANEDGWDIDWSMDDPDPEFLDREAFHTLFPDNRVKRYEFNGESI